MFIEFTNMNWKANRDGISLYGVMPQWEKGDLFNGINPEGQVIQEVDGSWTAVFQKQVHEPSTYKANKQGMAILDFKCPGFNSRKEAAEFVVFTMTGNDKPESYE